MIGFFKKIYSKFHSKFIDGFDLWQQMLNVAVIFAIFASLISAVISLALDSSFVAIGAFLFTAVFAIICLFISLYSKDVIYAAVIFSIVANFVLFPAMYFFSGGYHGGMPMWLLLSLVISWVIIRKKILYVIYILSVVFQSGCILYSEVHPELVENFPDEHAIAIDVVQSLILVSLIFGFIIKYQGRAYEKKQEELDKANALLEEANERITLQSMYTLAKTIDAKDRYTNGHSMRVAKYSKMIADNLDFSEEDSENLYHMAMLHDIGKIGIPDTIINKTSSLTDEEYAIIKMHPTIGSDILSEMPEFEDIGTGARWHHERYDGTGYPDSLKGGDIPLNARIISVADAYDAMTSNRSYRKYMAQPDVKSELEKGKGQQFDPKIADIMLDIMAKDEDYELHE